MCTYPVIFWTTFFTWTRETKWIPYKETTLVIIPLFYLYIFTLTSEKLRQRKIFLTENLYAVCYVVAFICFLLSTLKLGFCNELLKIWFTQDKWRVIHPKKTVKLFCLSRLHCESSAWVREMWDRPHCSGMLLYILNVHELLWVADRWKNWTNVNSMNINQF